MPTDPTQTSRLGKLVDVVDGDTTEALALLTAQWIVLDEFRRISG